MPQLQHLLLHGNQLEPLTVEIASTLPRYLLIILYCNLLLLLYHAYRIRCQHVVVVFRTCKCLP